MFFVLIVGLCADAAFGPAEPEEDSPLAVVDTVAWLPAAFAAYDKGFFRDEGFDVELIHMPATPGQHCAQ